MFDKMGEASHLMWVVNAAYRYDQSQLRSEHALVAHKQHIQTVRKTSASV